MNFYTLVKQKILEHGPTKSIAVAAKAKAARQRKRVLTEDQRIRKNERERNRRHNDEYRAHHAEEMREWRAKQSPEWKHKELEKLRNYNGRRGSSKKLQGFSERKVNGITFYVRIIHAATN